MSGEDVVDNGHVWPRDLMAHEQCPCRRCGLDYMSNDYDLSAECPGVRPAYRNAGFAVYPIDEEYRVMRYGGDDGEPFRTTDADLAREVCDSYADSIGGR